MVTKVVTEVVTGWKWGSDGAVKWVVLVTKVTTEMVTGQ